MKKLLVLMLVLAMASLASAEVTMNIYVNGSDPGDEYSMAAGDAAITIYGTVPANEYTGVYFIAAGDGSMSNGAISTLGNCTFASISPGAFIDPDNEELGTWGDFFADMGYADTATIYDLTLADSAYPFVAITGDIFSATLTFASSAATLAIIDYTGEEYVTYDTLSIVPEPMTIALLGLGGLLLRRRK